MKLINASRDFDKAEAYRLTHNTSISVKDLVGEILQVKDWLFYEDTNSRGELVNILVLDTDRGYVSTISQTFKKQFDDICQYFDLPVNIICVGGQTKSGRDFVSCELA